MWNAGNFTEQDGFCLVYHLDHHDHFFFASVSGKLDGFYYVEGLERHKFGGMSSIQGGVVLFVFEVPDMFWKYDEEVVQSILLRMLFSTIEANLSLSI